MSKSLTGTFFLILGPSGIGKGTTIQMLKERHPEFFYPVSCTTRAPRPGEVDGVVYHFISQESFKEHIEAGDFLEYAFIHQQQYSGILKAPVLEALAAGKTVVREANYEGYESIMKTELAPHVVSLFLTVAEPELLLERIQKRSQLEPAELAHRLESAKKELADQDRYDHVVTTVEGDPEAVYREVERIISGTPASGSQ